jgi:UDP-N-acetylmuramoyl-L-alanyl-D-glutamate--2,6-diaminopimelate ligase
MMAPLVGSSVHSLKELLGNFTAESVVHDIFVSGLSIDSRNIEAGYLFVAAQGVISHGRQFITQAIENGACAVLIDETEDAITSTIPVIKIPCLQNVLSKIAGRFYHNPSSKIPVYGITGTNGKTTCSHLLAQCLAAYDVNCGVMGTLGYGVVSVANSSINNAVSANAESYKQAGEPAEKFTTTGMTTADPISTQKICAELLACNAQAIVMEVSSHGLVQHRVEDIDINTAVFTNLTQDHLDYHVSMKAYGEAKARLFDMPCVINAVINQDDDFSGELIKHIQKNVRLATYSLSEQGAKYAQSVAHFSFSHPKYTSQGVTAVLHTPEGEFSVATQLVGAFNLSNMLAVISSLYLNNYSLKKIISLLPSLKSVPGRMELIANQIDLQVVVDFAHTPDALKSALRALRTHLHNNIWCVFGCGGDRDTDKRAKMAAIAEQLANHIVVTNDNPRTESAQNIFNDIKQGFSREHRTIENRADAIAYAIAYAGKGDIVLIAGKGHEDYQIIGSEKIQFNDREQAQLSLHKREQEGAL